MFITTDGMNVTPGMHEGFKLNKLYISTDHMSAIHLLYSPLFSKSIIS